MKFPEQFRFNHPQMPPAPPGSRYGGFLIAERHNKQGRRLFIIASDASESYSEGWEHVSVSLPDYPKKCPSWEEMCMVKSLFWNDDECIVQFHPAAGNYVNHHAGCLHLWKDTKQPFSTPPKILVGPSS